MASEFEPIESTCQTVGDYPDDDLKEAAGHEAGQPEEQANV